MKKIFLLTLLSVFILSAYSQYTSTNPEIITKINIIKSAEDDEIPASYERGWFIFFYKEVKTIPSQYGLIVTCKGWGWKICYHRNAVAYILLRGIAPELVEATCEDLVSESEERIIDGAFQGSITRKIALRDDHNGGNSTYFLFKIDWDHDSENIRNGTAEITISKVTSLGF